MKIKTDLFEKYYLDRIEQAVKLFIKDSEVEESLLEYVKERAHISFTFDQFRFTVLCDKPTQVILKQAFEIAYNKLDGYKIKLDGSFFEFTKSY